MSFVRGPDRKGKTQMKRDDHRPRVIHMADHLAHLRAKLAADLLARPENRNQDADARLWGDRRAS